MILHKDRYISETQTFCSDIIPETHQDHVLRSFLLRKMEKEREMKRRIVISKHKVFSWTQANTLRLC